MEDLKEELRKLDPNRLLGYLHYAEEEFEAGESITLEYYDNIRFVTESEMSDDYRYMLENINPAITVEITCPGETYWLVIPVKFPTPRHIKKIYCEVIVSLGFAAQDSYRIAGTVLPRNRDLVPDTVIPILGDFYAKH